MKSVYNYKEDEKKNLLDLIDSLKIHREEAFSGEYLDTPKIAIIGPTKEYYESLLPNFRNRLDFQTSIENVEENSYSVENDTHVFIYRFSIRDTICDTFSISIYYAWTLTLSFLFE